MISIAIILFGLPAASNDDVQCSEFYSKQDWVSAYEPCLRAARLGDLEAQMNIGNLFFTGRSGHKNLQEAFNWYLAAAKQGDELSQRFVAFLFFTGSGVPQSYLQAHMWYNIAASNGASDAFESRRFVENWMTVEQIVEAQSLAQRCVGSNYIDC